MATSENAPIRPQTSDVAIATASGGSLSGSGTIYLWVQARNRTGHNLLSDGAATPTTTGVTVAYTVGQKITITFNSGARLAGEDIWEFQVSGSATNDHTTAQVLASIRAKETATVGTVNYPGRGANLSLPLVIELTDDEHIGLGVTVADSAALPSSPVHGMVRYVTDPGAYWRFDDQASSGLFASSGGYWVAHRTGFSSYVASTTQGASSTQPQGYARPINQIASGTQSDELLDVAPYLFDGTLQDSGYAPLFAISNNTGNSPITQGTRIETRWYSNGNNISTAFAGQAIATLLGKIDLDAGTLDVTADGVGSPVTLGPSLTGIGGLTTPEDLSPGNAWLYRLQLQTDQSAINTNQGPIAEGDELTFYPKIEGVLGERAIFAQLTGSGVISVGNQMIVLPSTGTSKAIMKDGSCLVLDEDNNQGYQIPDSGDRDIDLIASSTDDQNIVISGPYNSVRVRATEGDIQSYEAKRAEIGTGLGPISGYYSASSWSSPVTIAGNTETLQVSVTHPTAIRTDYPDTQIAGKTADFNPAQLAVLVRFGGTIYEVASFNRVASPQVITVTNIGSTTLGSAYDSSADNYFGLFGYGTITPSAVTSGSSLAAGDYEVAIAYRYDGGQVTRISHATSDNCIPVADLDYFELLAARGQTGFTTTTADYTQPAVNANVTVSVSSSAFMINGQPVLVAGGGEYLVDSTPTSTSVVLQNRGAGSNAVVGATISSSAKVTPTGTPGNSAYGLFFAFDTTLTSGAGTGDVRFNNATPASVTEIYVSETSSSGLDATSLISSLTNGSKLIFREQGDSNLHMYAVSGSITDNGSDRTIPVTHETGTGTFSNNASLFVTSSIKGDTGAAGTDGSDGAAATIAAGTTTTGSPGTSAFVSNSGSSSAAVFDFTIPKGAAGVPFGTRHTFDTGTANTPSTGELRFNSATISSATEIYVNETDRNALAIATVLNNIPNGSRISVISDGDETAIAYFSVTSSSSASSVTTLTVTHLAGSPTFTDGIDITLQTEGKGDTGATGTAGDAGVDAGLPYEFDSGIASGASSGEIRFNNATLSSVTQIFVHTEDRNAVDLSAFWDEVNTNAFIQVQSQTVASTYALFQITGQAGTTERTLNVAHIGSNGTFSDADNVGLVFLLKGDAGAAGSAGNDGADGADGVVTYGAITIETESTFPYNFVLADEGKCKHFNSASAATVNLPSGIFNAGTQIALRAIGDGQISIAGTGGMVIQSPNGLKLRTKYSSAALLIESSTLAYLDGDTEV